MKKMTDAHIVSLNNKQKKTFFKQILNASLNSQANTTITTSLVDISK